MKRILSKTITDRISTCAQYGGQRLNLSSLGLRKLPSEILQFSALEQLDLTNNALREIPPALFALTNLRVLSLQKNDISCIPAEIGGLNKLVRLNLNDNNIITIDENIGMLHHLTTLYLSRNKLRSLPKAISELANLKVLSLNDNYLTIPYEILSGSIAGLRNYIASLEDGSAYTLCEAKVLIVGEGDVGKTKLCHAILSYNNEDSPASTKGIGIYKWSVSPHVGKPSYGINLWDFGGQEIYHATHQYFLTKKSLYLFLWTARTDDDFHSFDYWLNVISLLSDNSPTLVVQNKSDVRTKEIDTKLVKSQFENVIGFLNTSAETGDGIESLLKRIIAEVEQLPHFYQTVPLAWVKIREFLETSGRPFIKHEEYLSICESYGVDKKRAEKLSEYFHVLGVFLHFPDNIILRQIIFLKPEWATGSVYRLFDDKEVISNRGYFTPYSLKRVWADYPSEQHPALVELMKKFELCFEMPQRQSYIIPSRLPASPPIDLPSIDKGLHYYYQYDFMPAGIVERVIVRLNALIFEDKYWKNGVVFRRESTIAIVEADRFKRRLSIHLEGTAKAELLAIVRNEIVGIHITLNSPKCSEKLPCICEDCLASNTPFFHDYHQVERARSKKKKSLECQQSFMPVDIGALLGGLDGTIESKENQIYELLKKLVDRFDTKETLAEKLNESLHLKPNLFGIGVNLNYLISKALKKAKG